MTPFNFGDTVLVGFPFTNLKGAKQRPAVVISTAAYRQDRPDVIVLAITSQIRQPLTFGECVLQDWQQAGLLKPSMLKPLIATLEQGQIIRVLGRLSPTDQNALRDVLGKLIG